MPCPHDSLGAWPSHPLNRQPYRENAGLPVGRPIAQHAHRPLRSPWRPLLGALLLALTGGAALAQPSADALGAWPRIRSPIQHDAALESRVAAIVAGMNLAQKVGQMTQPEIQFISPDEVRRYYIGSVLNGGGSWPGKNKHASARNWVQLAQAYHQASMSTDMAVRVPVIWGTDAVHGHGNVFGATLFPHNIGLGATRDHRLVSEIGAATAKAMRATGISWAFAPTLAVVQDQRWGRSYESFSDDPAIVERLGGAFVRGMQGTLGSDSGALATAKHYLGDGGTQAGRDQGVTRVSAQTLRELHARGYYAALGAGAQTVMASFNSWYDAQRGIDHGKIHGSQLLLTELLKTRMGFDGLVVSDWNGIGQIKGCSNASCAQAINAGIDLVMVPEDWKAFIANTIAQVERGEIPMSRIDDAVSRILRVKLRAGLFEQAPAQNRLAGLDEALQARELARRAARESLVLLKNNGQVLPLRRGQRVLVVGKAADNMGLQTGGWTLTWQGTGNLNSDFPVSETVLAGLRSALGDAQLVYSADARGVQVKDFDAVIAVIGETPYAEGNGDIPASGTLSHSSRYPEDLAVLKAVAGRGKPVISVLLSGRALHVNDLLNLSDAFVAAWLPGSEGGAIADVLLRSADGRVAHDFRGKLPVPWPRSACQTPLNRHAGGKPLFALGYGLRYGQHQPIAQLDIRSPHGGCSGRTEEPIFERNVQDPYHMQLASPTKRWGPQEIGEDLNARWSLPPERPDIELSTTQINTQQDAKLLRWSGPARLLFWSPQRAALGAYPEAALAFDIRIEQPPQGQVLLSMACGEGCGAELDLSRVLKRLRAGEPHSLKIPLACFVERGLDASRVDEPFNLSTAAPFTAAIAHIRVGAGLAKDADALTCAELAPTAP